MTNKEKDTVAIVNYLQGRGTIDVDDIMAHSGAEELRVYAILFELEKEGVIEVVKRENFGNVKLVRLVGTEKGER